MRFHHVYFNKTEGGTLYPELQSQHKNDLIHLSGKTSLYSRFAYQFVRRWDGIPMPKHQQAQS